jgi:hypothetical protein
MRRDQRRKLWQSSPLPRSTLAYACWSVR